MGWGFAMNIKKLAQRVGQTKSVKWGYSHLLKKPIVVDQKHLDDLLDAIDNAIIETDYEYHLGRGTIIFIPDKQPTLKEAVRQLVKVLDQPGAEFHREFNTLKAALEREDG
jgi:hypothetical protein